MLNTVVVLTLFLYSAFFHVPCSLAQPSTPFLTLNTLMHTGTIDRISADAQGRYVLTASRDKTAKLWDARSGELIRTFRIPMENGKEGKLRACAISPNGAFAALAGWTGFTWSGNFSIYIFNLQTGLMAKRIEDLPGMILDLEFTPDGSSLAASMEGKNGIRFYRTYNWGLSKSFAVYENDVPSVCFDSRGRMATASFDGIVRLYDAAGNLAAQSVNLAGKKPCSVSFSPDGSKLAVGYADAYLVEVLDGDNLQLLYRPDITSANTYNTRITTVCFSSDGTLLYGGGAYSQFKSGGWLNQLRRWSDTGKGDYADLDACRNTIMDIKSLPGGDMLFAGSYPDFGRMSAAGKKICYRAAETNDYAAKNRSPLKINYSGSLVAFRPLGKDEMSFSVPGKKLSPGKNSDINKASTDHSGNLLITDYRGNSTPKLNGKILPLTDSEEKSMSADISFSLDNIIIGTGTSLYCFGNTGLARWAIPLPDAAFAVDIAPNEKVVVAALGDGTIRWFRMSDGQEMLALYAHPDNLRWVMWTPSGYYDCSEGAEDLIGWHINNGAGREAGYYPASKFRNTFYRPDVISRILETLDGNEALRLANLENNRKPANMDIAKMLPPTVVLNYPLYGQEFSSTNVYLKYAIQSPNNEPVTSVIAFINGRKVVTQTVFKPAGNQQEIELTVPGKDCKIELIAENRFGFSEPVIVNMLWKGEAGSEEMVKPKLYMVAIGVSNYKDTNYRLMFGAKDARDFAACFASQKGQLYSDVIAKVLTEKYATRDSIVDALEWLRKETTSRDVAVLFLSGHGMMDNSGEFCFLPFNADLNHVLRTCVMSEEIKKITGNVAGKMLVFIDACHSGNLSGKGRRVKSPDIPALVNELVSAENGTVVIFSSCIGTQFSMEDRSWGNGAFTRALVEGIQGKANLVRLDKITVLSLGTWVSERVKELTGGKQTPTVTPSGGADYPIAVVKP